jgi:polyisoprenyl-teichoic acid--peptidoglycan teichoic acid transferase
MNDPLSHYQPIRIAPNRHKRSFGCATPGCILLIALPLIVLLSAYFFLPFSTNFLLMGIDRAQEKTDVSRTDTLMLFTVHPLTPYIGMVSIPRDLWVAIPGIGENRINTAHFFAEAAEAGTGPQAAAEAVEANFNISVPYTIRIRFDGFVSLVDAMGGVDLDLPKATGGLTAGQHHLNGTQALAFARDRSGTDDFFRMADGQTMLKAVFQQMLEISNWLRIPAELGVIFKSVDTDIPIWLWPRLIVAFIRTGSSGIDNYVISREMVQNYVTDQGADVLLPDWDLIRPFVAKILNGD